MLTSTGIIIFWIIVAAISIVGALIHIGIAEGFDFIDIGDFFEVFFEDYVWITFFSPLALGAIIFGFLNWIWWAMLLIVIGIVSIPIVIFIILHSIDVKQTREYEENSKIKTETREQTAYVCPNCGARITKIIIKDLNGCSETKYSCEHCNTIIGKRQMLGIANPNMELETFDLDDWEEEYFDACQKMNFKPHNNHSQKQIDKRHDSIKNKIDMGEDIYNNEDEWDEDILDEAYEFFTDNIDEIKEYLKNHSADEIQKRFNYYCILQEIDDEEEE